MLQQNRIMTWLQEPVTTNREGKSSSAHAGGPELPDERAVNRLRSNAESSGPDRGQGPRRGDRALTLKPATLTVTGVVVDADDKLSLRPDQSPGA